MKAIIKSSYLLLALILLSACASTGSKDGAPSRTIDVTHIPNAVPKAEAKSKYGNPPSYVVFGHRYYVSNSSTGYDKRGIASWYGTKFHKRRTSSGEPYNMFAMTAANKTLPLPTFVQVTNLQNGRQIIVKVNDRGPFEKNRIIDLSYVAAKKLGMLAHGTALVEVKAINPYVWAENHGRLPARKPTPKVPGHPQLYLQVAALSNLQNAKRLQLQLMRIVQEPTRIETLHNANHDTYRVQIGPIASVDSSDGITEQLTQAGYHQPMTVIE